VNRLSKYVLAALLFAGTAQATPLHSTNATTTYHRVQVDGVGIFYREAGPENAPTIVLLHGFPSSSREFDTLIPLLATKYHLIAPDYPGFGLSDAPSPTTYTYMFDHLAQTMSDFLEKLKVTHYIRPPRLPSHAAHAFMRPLLDYAAEPRNGSTLPPRWVCSR
jgi:pimeloyl-ACP methyl ester carboxylesterase